MTDFNEQSGKFFSIKDLPEVRIPTAEIASAIVDGDEQVRYHVWDSQEILYRPYPLFVARQQICWNLKAHLTLPASLSVIRRALVRNRDFAIMSHDSGRLLINSIGSHRSHGDEDGDSIHREYMKDAFSTRYADDLAVVICNDGHKNYWHWHAQTMLSVMFVDQLGLRGKIRFVVCQLNSWQKESLATFGIHDDEILEIDAGYSFFDRLIYPSFLDPRSYIAIDPYLVDLFRIQKRNTFIASSAQFIQPRPERLYVSRKDAPQRTMKNERELVAVLQKFGFQEVIPSEMTYLEQIASFSSAKVVVGIHGAGLTNIGFQNKGALCIEIFDTHYTHYMYYVFSRLCGLDYECVLTDALYHNTGTERKWDPDIISLVQSILQQMHRYGHAI